MARATRTRRRRASRSSRRYAGPVKRRAGGVLCRDGGGGRRGFKPPQDFSRLRRMFSASRVTASASSVLQALPGDSTQLLYPARNGAGGCGTGIRVGGAFAGWSVSALKEGGGGRLESGGSVQSLRAGSPQWLV